MIAYCGRDGVIRFGRRKPLGTLQIAAGDSVKLRDVIEGCARLAYDNKTLLVPGIPEAEDGCAAVEALFLFSQRVRQRLVKGAGA